MKTVSFVVRIPCTGDIDETKALVREQLIESGPWQGDSRIRVDSFRSNLDEFRLQERYLATQIRKQDMAVEKERLLAVAAKEIAGRRASAKAATKAENARILNLPKAEQHRIRAEKAALKEVAELKEASDKAEAIDKHVDLLRTRLASGQQLTKTEKSVLRMADLYLNLATPA